MWTEWVILVRVLFFAYCFLSKKLTFCKFYWVWLHTFIRCIHSGLSRELCAGITLKWSFVIPTTWTIHSSMLSWMISFNYEYIVLMTINKLFMMDIENRSFKKRTANLACIVIISNSLCTDNNLRKRILDVEL